MNSKNRNFTVALALAGFGLSASAAITNGSFEAPDVGNVNQQYADGSTAINGWTVVGGAQLVDVSFLAPAFNLVASQGSQWVDLTGETGYGKGVETTFAGASGATYTLSFDVGRLMTAAFGFATVEVKADGTSLGTFTNDAATTGVQTMNWKPFSTSFVSDGSTVLTFLSSSAGGGLDQVVGLDNVAVVPEPGTYAMLLAGLAAVGFVAKRRRA